MCHHQRARVPPGRVSCRLQSCCRAVLSRKDSQREYSSTYYTTAILTYPQRDGLISPSGAGKPDRH